MSETIKPCPFCGETDVLIGEGSTFRWRVARCGNCDAQTGDVRIPVIGKDYLEQWERVIKNLAMAEWNTRATQQESGK